MSILPRYCTYRVTLTAVFSFIFGCMFMINIASIERTCKLENTNREFNIMNNSKLKGPDLIVLILSAPKNLDKRNSIRETWLKLHSDDTKDTFKIKHYFVVGSHSLETDDIRHISGEQSQHSDILILPMVDSYKNLTLKVLMSFAYLTDQIDFGLRFKYVLKCDDDTFVRLDKLPKEIEKVTLLYSTPSSNFESVSPYIRVNVQSNDVENTSKLGIYWGYFNGNAHIKNAGKWKETNYILCDKYVTYALGGGYIVSKELVQFLGKNLNSLRLYHSEDVSVGAWLASVNNIVRVHDARFDTEWSTRGCQNFYLVTHSIPIIKMHQMYKSIIRNDVLCQEEVTKRQYWIYDWSLPPSKCCTKSV